MLNHVSIIGRLTKDPELRYTQNNKAVVSFRVAVDREISEGADFVNVIGWGKTAEFVDKYFRKGMLIVVVGRLTSREWEKDGKKQYATEVTAERVWFGEPKRKVEEQDEGAFKELDDADGELPF